MNFYFKDRNSEKAQDFISYWMLNDENTFDEYLNHLDKRVIARRSMMVVPELLWDSDDHIIGFSLPDLVVNDIEVNLGSDSISCWAEIYYFVNKDPRAPSPQTRTCDISYKSSNIRSVVAILQMMHKGDYHSINNEIGDFFSSYDLIKMNSCSQREDPDGYTTYFDSTDMRCPEYRFDLELTARNGALCKVVHVLNKCGVVTDITDTTFKEWSHEF